MHFTTPATALSILSLFLAPSPASAAAGYCNTVISQTELIQHGDYVNIVYVDLPSFSKSGRITQDCIMDNGASGSGVKSLQSTLNLCHGESLAVDGDYGGKTKAAVKRVQ
jgi:peptidoglycan hydrolase-like protein with peptidoglycan-binding domain